MTLDPERALQGAIFARLRGDPALSALLGDPVRVYDEPPADPVYPYLTLARSEAKPWGGTEGEGVEHTLTLSVVSHFGGAEEAKAVSALIRASLHNAALSLEDHRLVNLRVTYADVFRSSEWRSTLGVLRLRAVTEPLE